MAAYLTRSDHELASLLQADDHGAYTALYERYFGLLYLHARKKVRNAEEARDITQDIFISLWNHRSSIDADQGVKAWLYACLRNKIIDWMAHQHVSSRYIRSFSQFPTSVCETDHRVREKELAAMIEKEIQALPPRMREIFLLSKRDHLKHKEIAQKLQLSEHTVKTQVKHALRFLRLRLGMIIYVFMLTKL